jgi:hypothetical protein
VGVHLPPPLLKEVIMKYFKIFKEDEFIGIARSDSFLTY